MSQLRPSSPQARAASPWTWLRPHAARLLAAALLILAYSALQILAPYLTGLAVDRHLIPRQPPGFTRLMLALLGVYLGTWATRALAAWLVAQVGQAVLYALRTALFARLQRLPLSFFDRQATGDVMARVMEDSDTAQVMLSDGLANALSHALLAAGLLSAMVWLQPRLALALLAIVPLLAVWAGCLWPRLLAAYHHARATAGRVQAELQEALSAVRLVQAFGQEETRQARMAEVTQESYEANLAAQRLNALYGQMVGVFNTAGLALVLGLGAWEVLQGRLSLGVLVTFLGYERRFFTSVQGLLSLAGYWQQFRAAWARLCLLWETAPEPQEDGALVLPPLRGEVRFEGVSFAYDETPVLQEVSFTVAPGQCVAIVGPTGVGKTTLVNLLLRFYTPQRGRILVDGYDIAQVDAASLRRQIGLVLQEPMLFAGTVLENLRYGWPDATEEEVMALMRELGTDALIRRLPEGYATRIGERGVTLSQGQKQLLALARTLLSQPRLLVLDEATSSVDRATERALELALQRLMAGRTTLLIAHRLSRVQHADWIVVLHEGRAVEQGTHAELLTRRGQYWRLWNAAYPERGLEDAKNAG